MDLVPYIGAIDWTPLTDGLTSAFEGGVGQVLPFVGVMIAAFIVFRVIKRFVGGN